MTWRDREEEGRRAGGEGGEEREGSKGGRGKESNSGRKGVRKTGRERGSEGHQNRPLTERERGRGSGARDIKTDH